MQMHYCKLYEMQENQFEKFIMIRSFLKIQIKSAINNLLPEVVIKIRIIKPKS